MTDQPEHTHHRISDSDQIPDLCFKTFVGIDNAVKMLWVTAIVIVLPATIAGIGWSIAIGKEQLTQNSKICEIEKKQTEISQINDKLDILLRRGDR